jgi:hypothetical protein
VGVAVAQGETLMLDLVKLTEVAKSVASEFKTGPDGYLCGPNTFRALLAKAGFIQRDQTTFVAQAGDLQVFVRVSLFVPDDGKFYPSGKQTLKARVLPRTF